MNKFSFIIPAREGSKRIKDKNILKFKSKSLIENAVSQSLSFNNQIENIIVSSDSSEYLSKIKNNAQIIKDLRPKKYADDDTKSEEMLYYLIKKYFYKISDNIILLQPTSPLRKIIDIIKCIKLYSSNQKNVISGYQSGKQLIINGSIYIFNKNKFLSNRKVIGNDFIFYKMPKNRSLDLDTKEDLLLLRKYE